MKQALVISHLDGKKNKAPFADGNQRLPLIKKQDPSRNKK
jgi:hypothetical protein